MAKKKKVKSNYLPIKNYIYGILLILAIIGLIWYVFSWYNIKKQEKLMKSYLISSNTLNYEIKDLSEIVQVLKESPSEYFVYISYNNNEDIYRLEKKLKKVIDDYSIKDEFYYINVTDIKDNKDTYSKLNDAFNTTKITNLPCILYFKNNVLEDVIMDKNNIFNINDFSNLLNKYEYQK